MGDYETACVAVGEILQESQEFASNVYMSFTCSRQVSIGRYIATLGRRGRGDVPLESFNVQWLPRSLLPRQPRPESPLLLLSFQNVSLQQHVLFCHRYIFEWQTLLATKLTPCSSSVQKVQGVEPGESSAHCSSTEVRLSAAGPVGQVSEEDGEPSLLRLSYQNLL